MDDFRKISLLEKLADDGGEWQTLKGYPAMVRRNAKTGELEQRKSQGRSWKAAPLTRKRNMFLPDDSAMYDAADRAFPAPKREPAPKPAPKPASGQGATDMRSSIERAMKVFTEQRAQGKMQPEQFKQGMTALQNQLRGLKDKAVETANRGEEQPAMTMPRGSIPEGKRKPGVSVEPVTPTPKTAPATTPRPVPAAAQSSAPATSEVPTTPAEDRAKVSLLGRKGPAWTPRAGGGTGEEKPAAPPAAARPAPKKGRGITAERKALHAANPWMATAASRKKKWADMGGKKLRESQKQWWEGHTGSRSKAGERFAAKRDKARAAGLAKITKKPPLAKTRAVAKNTPQIQKPVASGLGRAMAPRSRVGNIAVAPPTTPRRQAGQNAVAAAPRTGLMPNLSMGAPPSRTAGAPRGPTGPRAAGGAAAAPGPSLAARPLPSINKGPSTFARTVTPPASPVKQRPIAGPLAKPIAPKKPILPKKPIRPVVAGAGAPTKPIPGRPLMLAGRH